MCKDARTFLIDAKTWECMLLDPGVTSVRFGYVSGEAVGEQIRTG